MIGVGDHVLDGLELADRLAERGALLAVGDHVLEHAGERAGAVRAVHDALAVERIGDHAPALVDLPEDVLIGDEDVVELDLAAAERAHPELWDRRRRDALAPWRRRGTR